MSLLNLIPAPIRMWALGAVCAAVLAFVGYQIHHQREIGREEVRTEWRKADAEEAEANAKETQRRLERAADAERKRDAILHDTNARLAVALSELRNRPERPASGDSTSTQACTGTGLYRPDAAFLAREAAAAARIAAERDYYYERYMSLTKPK